MGEGSIESEFENNFSGFLKDLFAFFPSFLFLLSSEYSETGSFSRSFSHPEDLSCSSEFL
jgi:hypothetical protein